MNDILTREQIEDILKRWNQAWAEHDLEAIMEFFHDDILFENWTGGTAQGKENLYAAWAGWFAEDQDFQFVEEDTFIDVESQKVLYSWRLDWPCREEGYQGRKERRRGVDILCFSDGKIIKILTYSKTTVEIDDQRVRLKPAPGALNGD